MFGVGCGYVNRVADCQHFGNAVGNLSAGITGELFRARLFQVVHRCYLHTLILNQDSSVYAGDVARAQETDLKFSHKERSTDYTDYTDWMKRLAPSPFSSELFIICVICGIK